MLENILNEINKNLEKIAETLLKIAYVNIEAENAVKVNVDNVAPVMPTQAPTVPMSQETITAPVNTTVTPTIPTTQPEGFTQEQLAVAMSNAVSAGKMDVIMGILKSFNVQALTQVNPADYNKVATMLQEAGVKI